MPNVAVMREFKWTVWHPEQTCTLQALSLQLHLCTTNSIQNGGILAHMVHYVAQLSGCLSDCSTKGWDDLRQAYVWRDLEPIKFQSSFWTQESSQPPIQNLRFQVHYKN